MKGEADKQALALIDKLYEEFLSAQRDGDAPSIEEHLERIAELRSNLQTRIDETVVEDEDSSATAPVPDSKSAGRIIGRYRVRREIGRGAMGVVFEAEDLDLGRNVALKVLPELFSAEPDRLKLFDQEARTLARMHHPGVVNIYGAGRHESTPYLAMELVDGKPLSAYLNDLRDVPVSERKASALPCGKPEDSYETGVVRLVIEVLQGVSAIHEQGIVHRDLKPDNLLVTKAGEIKIADFGLAKDIVTSSGLTSLGRPRGTPLYMSPEQASGNLMGLDHRSDLFSIGVILFELLAGCQPFQGESWQSVAKAIVTSPAPRVRKLSRRVNRSLSNVLDRALEKDFEKRYPTATSFADDLKRYLRKEPVVLGRPSLADRFRRFTALQSPLALVGLPLFYIGLPLCGVASELDSTSLAVIGTFVLFGSIGLLIAGFFHKGKRHVFPVVALVPVALVVALAVLAPSTDDDESPDAAALGQEAEKAFAGGDHDEVVEILGELPLKLGTVDAQLLLTRSLWALGEKEKARALLEALADLSKDTKETAGSPSAGE